MTWANGKRTSVRSSQRIFGYDPSRHAKRQRNVKLACATLEVSRTAFYDWARPVPSNHDPTDAELLAKIKIVHAERTGRDGAPRIDRELIEQGVACRCKRVAYYCSCSSRHLYHNVG